MKKFRKNPAPQALSPTLSQPRRFSLPPAGKGCQVGFSTKTTPPLWRRENLCENAQFVVFRLLFLCKPPVHIHIFSTVWRTVENPCGQPCGQCGKPLVFNSYSARAVFPSPREKPAYPDAYHRRLTKPGVGYVTGLARKNPGLPGAVGSDLSENSRRAPGGPGRPSDEFCEKPTKFFRIKKFMPGNTEPVNKRHGGNALQG